MVQMGASEKLGERGEDTHTLKVLLGELRVSTCTVELYRESVIDSVKVWRCRART